MNLEKEDRRFPDKGFDKLDAVLKKPKISYSSDFLLPTGLVNHFVKLMIPCKAYEVDQEFLGACLFRVSDETSTDHLHLLRGYSRGIYGKWDTCSSGRSDTEIDSQSNWDSDFGRRYGHHSRWSWQSTEQDGLLGSGSFPDHLDMQLGSLLQR